MYSEHVRVRPLLTGFALMLIALPAIAGSVYQEPADYVRQVFAGKPPLAKTLWLTPELQEKIAATIGHTYPGMRLRYWERGSTRVWIVDEIGKEQPITTGVAITNGRIENVSVLIFRESRGWEVRHDFFTRQFSGAAPGRHEGLDRRIDTITGATLSVRALIRQAQLALLLNQHVDQTTAGAAP